MSAAKKRLTKTEEVMAQMATALEKCDKHFQHRAGYVCDAIAVYGAWKAWAAWRQEGSDDNSYWSVLYRGETLDIGCLLYTSDNLYRIP